MKGQMVRITIHLNGAQTVQVKIGSGEVIPRPHSLCKSKSTACRLSSQWPRTDHTSQSQQFMNSTSERFLIGSPCQIHSL
jgi:hypothetical protein